MFKVDNNNISLIRGDSGAFTISIADTNGTPVELTDGDVLTFTLRRTPWSPTIVLQKTITDGTLTINPSDTQDMPFGSYVYDVELKRQRDTAEVAPIAYNGHSFDYDDKARDRINAAIIALSLQGEGASIDWTTADNTEVTVTSNDLRAIIAAIAVRSNELHIRYRNAKAKVEEAQTAKELEAIEL